MSHWKVLAVLFAKVAEMHPLEQNPSCHRCIFQVCIPACWHLVTALQEPNSSVAADGLALGLDGSAVRAPGQPPGLLWAQPSLPRKESFKLLQPPADFRHPGNVSRGRSVTLVKPSLLITPAVPHLLSSTLPGGSGWQLGGCQQNPLKAQGPLLEVAF